MKFDQHAESYDLHAAPQRSFALRVAQFAAAQASEQVLELGAGTGALTSSLLALNPLSVRATDASAAMVEVGRRVVPQARWGVLDGFSGRVPEADLQISSGLLQWAPEPLGVLLNWSRSLSPNGRMVHAFPCDPCLCEWRALVQAGPIRWRNENEWLKAFESSGLRVLRHELWVERHILPSALRMLQGWHRSGVTGPSHLTPGELRRRLREYDSRHRCPTGVYATWAWLVVEARPS